MHNYSACLQNSSATVLLVETLDYNSSMTIFYDNKFDQMLRVPEDYCMGLEMFPNLLNGSSEFDIADSNPTLIRLLLSTLL